MLHPNRARATAKSRAFRPDITVFAQLGHMTAAGLLSRLTQPPPVERWHPAHCGDSDMRIGRDGTWFHQGTPIGRMELVRLFASLLRKDDDGFVLVTPAEKLSILVEDVPFIAVAMTVMGEGRTQSLFLPPIWATKAWQERIIPCAL
jgi:hypothetical protein